MRANQTLSPATAESGSPVLNQRMHNPPLSSRVTEHSDLLPLPCFFESRTSCFGDPSGQRTPARWQALPPVYIGLVRVQPVLTGERTPWFLLREMVVSFANTLLSGKDVAQGQVET